MGLTNRIWQLVKFVAAVPICLVGVLLPHHLRTRYTQLLSFFAHLPYVIYGSMTRYMLNELEIEPSSIPWKTSEDEDAAAQGGDAAIGEDAGALGSDDRPRPHE